MECVFPLPSLPDLLARVDFLPTLGGIRISVLSTDELMTTKGKPLCVCSACFHLMSLCFCACRTGEFNYLYSPENDFAVQIRVWGLWQSVSMIGGVAVKTGDSVVTITRGWLIPLSIRVDGVLISIPNDSSTLVLDDHLRNANGISVRVRDAGRTVSFEFLEGFTFGVSCQDWGSGFWRSDFFYMSVQLHGIEIFEESSAGLAGTFNGDSSDDFTGPNGESFTSPSEFAESWRVTQWRNMSDTRSDGSLPWSWDTKVSNFHPHDLMGFEYGLPTHVTLPIEPGSIRHDELTRPCCHSREYLYYQTLWAHGPPDLGCDPCLLYIDVPNQRQPRTLQLEVTDTGGFSPFDSAVSTQIAAATVS